MKQFQTEKETLRRHTMFKAITAAQAKKINIRLGLSTWEGDGQKTYWATNEDETETYDFDSIRERNAFLDRNNRDAE